LDKRVAGAILRAVEEKGGLTVEELVDEIEKSIDVSKHEVVRHLYWLWKVKGDVKLEDTDPPSTFWRYVKSFYSVWFLVLVAAVMLTASAIYILPQAVPYIYMRYVLGSLFVLFLPGFALVESLFPKKQDITSLERVALSIGLSLAVVPLVGLMLNYTPWGIRLNSVFTSLAILTFAFSMIALQRKFSHFKTEMKLSMLRNNE